MPRTDAEHSSRSIRWKIATILACAVVTASIVTGVFATVKPSDSPSVTVAQQDPSSGGSAVLASVRFGDAWSRINDTTTPFVVTVAGDSTGNAPGEWVDRAFHTLAESMSRPLVIHFWNERTHKYDLTSRANGGAGSAPIIVWNGSASGKTPAYSLKHLDQLMPEQPDAVIINHGLNNVRNPDSAAPQIQAFMSAVEARWDEAIGYAVILENPRFDRWKEPFENVVTGITEWAQPLSNVLLINVYDAYLESDNLDQLLFDDRLHPNTAGSQFTADVVLSAIADAAA
ncbi:SGNH/GDSL hydrolase family protein [Paramicrobacterium chengjingii]|uniref:SGNH/GDSL hydrolase family protein n=1 Tax=Paramicrobacterium chengjingii TaxID=2769067 RepID=A0ABX6YM26_9MICO|nr:SGNH/GDSL hydrolase family protein [Microbacterium chengjingii]QPZ39846.1 SGNH/GDSL hydrolase family protein [Microbacterium chengjingii]